MGQRSQERQLAALQLRHEPNAAHVDSQDGHLVKGGVPGGVKDRAVPAKADEQVGGGQLLVQQGEGQLPGQVQPVPFFGLKGQAHHRFGSGMLQHPLGLQSGPQSLVPVWVGAEYDLHIRSSFQALWDCSTSAFKSPL